MKTFKLLNVIKKTDNESKIKRLKMLGYKEVKAKETPKKKGDKK